jgi:hypothetical protein
MSHIVDLAVSSLPIWRGSRTSTGERRGFRSQTHTLPRTARLSWHGSYIGEFASWNSSISTPRTTLAFFIFGSDLFRILRKSTRDVRACLSMAVMRSPFRKPSSSARLAGAENAKRIGGLHQRSAEDCGRPFAPRDRGESFKFSRQTGLVLWENRG